MDKKDIESLTKLKTKGYTIFDIVTACIDIPYNGKNIRSEDNVFHTWYVKQYGEWTPDTAFFYETMKIGFYGGIAQLKNLKLPTEEQKEFAALLHSEGDCFKGNHSIGCVCSIFNSGFDLAIEYIKEINKSNFM